MQTRDIVKDTTINERGFPREFSVCVAGKMGETKVISLPVSDKRLLVFRPSVLEVYDNIGGRGAALLDLDIGGISQLYHKPLLTTEYSLQAGRGLLYDLAHPKASVTFKVKFIKDCVFSATFKGRAVEVFDDGIYSVIPSFPCNRIFDDKEVDYLNNSPWQLDTTGGLQCSQCWFKYDRHKKWPWKKTQLHVDTGIVHSGNFFDNVINTENLLIPFIADAKQPEEGQTWHKYNETRDLFRTSGFSLDGKHFTGSQHKDGDRFTYYINSRSWETDRNIRVPSESGFTFRVYNATAEQNTFQGTITAMEQLRA